MLHSVKEILSADKLLYFKSYIPENYGIATKTTLGTISNWEMEIYMVNTDESSDTHSKTYQCGYNVHKHSGSIVWLLKSEEWN